ncbi:MAG: hypothetical protein JW864_15925 [Spirochaetes bacterium]|nr:hypothetical protein [Spirochaetota bacterium]
MKALLRIFILLLLSCLFLQCKSANTLEREILSPDTFHTRSIDNKCAMYIDRNFEISIQEAREGFLDDFFNSTVFRNVNIKYDTANHKELLLILLISNTGRHPFEISNIYINYANITLETLNAEQLSKNRQSFNDALFGYYSIKTKDMCLKDTGFSEKITAFDGKSIKPGDKVIRLIAFNRIPAQFRNFKINVKVKSDIIQKIVDFKFIRFEYRHSGHHFVKPKNNND